MHLRRKVRLLALAASAVVFVHASAEVTPALAADSESSGGGFTVGSAERGLGLGNVKRLRGLRLNVLDRDVETVHGVDLSLCGWPPDANPDAEFRGWTLGGICLSGKSFSGITVSLAGLCAEESTAGMNVGGLGIVFSKGEVVGISAAILGVYADGGIRGLSVAPLGMVGSSERIEGVNVALFGVFAREGLLGANAAGIIGSKEDITGVNLGLGCVSNGTVRGITAAGFIRAGSLVGLDLAAILVADEMSGVSVAPVWVCRGNQVGFSAGLATVTLGKQTGVTAGAVNYAQDLKGVQVGLLNIVRTNPPPFRFLPFMNCRF